MEGDSGHLTTHKRDKRQEREAESERTCCTAGFEEGRRDHEPRNARNSAGDAEKGKMKKEP
jgi:hypothetical protein